MLAATLGCGLIAAIPAQAESVRSRHADLLKPPLLFNEARNLPMRHRRSRLNDRSLKVLQRGCGIGGTDIGIPNTLKDRLRRCPLSDAQFQRGGGGFHGFKISHPYAQVQAYPFGVSIEW